MKLLDAIRQKVPGQIQSRGHTYFTSGRVKSVEFEDGTLDAVVEGGRTYNVTMEFFEGHEIGYSCSCPHFGEEGTFCKHVWAALLAAAASKLLPEWDLKKALLLTPFPDDDLVGESDEFDEDFERDPDDLDGDGVTEGDYGVPRPPSPSMTARARQIQAEKMRRYWERVRETSPYRMQPVRVKPDWKSQLVAAREAASQRWAPPTGQAEAWPAGREVVYVLAPESGSQSGDLTVSLAWRDRKKNGEWRRPRRWGIGQGIIGALEDPRDRQLLRALFGAPKYPTEYDRSGHFYPPADHLADLIPKFCSTGRCFLALGPVEGPSDPFEWDDGEPWQLEVAVRREEKAYVVSGALVRGDERASLEQPAAVFSNGFFYLRGRLSRYRTDTARGWIGTLRRDGCIRVPVSGAKTLVKELLAFPSLPRMMLPEELRIEELRPPCVPVLRLRRARTAWERGRLYAVLRFEYGGFRIASTAAAVIVDTAKRQRILRDPGVEASASRLLERMGFRTAYTSDEFGLQLAETRLPQAVRELTAAGWKVEAEGKLFRTAGDFKIEVASGIDWFELRGTVQFGDASARLPELLAALKRKEGAIVLDDGSVGILPEEWLRRYGVLAGLGTAEGDHLRFSRSQTGLLDALLAAEPAASCDEKFEQARRRLREFAGVAPAEPGPGFTGELRGYQREGLGWIHFLREFGFGGCLADDMGLGKTVQVLALLETRCDAKTSAARAEGPHVSLVVAPRSLIFNWKQEAARFAPRLRVLDHTGMQRSRTIEAFDGYDLVLTTYGTLRRDIARIKDRLFDYVILDEAQSIKNAATDSAKAARLLKANHRLALSGTPVENHLGELWSLFEFLNPGMLGTSSVLKLGEGELRKPDPAARELLARALRPFILRRTKAQVAPDLPGKVEQTLYCELDASQRRLYNDLRDHYRALLLSKVEREGIGRNKIQILEALLRLRQAAIHPGLIDPELTAQSGAKLEALLPQLEEVVDEGHKALVFSQFTSMLAILKPKLEERSLAFAYLDGQTRDREAEVGRFQNDPGCPLFLISLKAGGLGLNLTAAEYVFLLDPWWNPAVEMQAIDRAHRIGQSRTVFAYRLIARDTVEERVLELQKNKRDLADAIINADNSLVRDLRVEDLELLLG
jgi:superfamily II DNA or RNA helicase